MRTYKFRIYPLDAQITILTIHLICAVTFIMQRYSSEYTHTDQERMSITTHSRMNFRNTAISVHLSCRMSPEDWIRHTTASSGG